MIENEQVEEIILILDDKLSKTSSVLKEDFGAIRAGRANPRILDKVLVDYYGAMTPIAQTSNISVQEGRCLVIYPWDTSLLKGIEKAIQVSNIGINPTNDGKCIRLVFPELTEERRRDLTKQIKKMGEDCFDTCTKLKEVYYNGTIDDWCKIDFCNMRANPISNATNLYFNGNLVSDIVIPDYISSITENLFAGYNENINWKG